MNTLDLMICVTNSVEMYRRRSDHYGLPIWPEPLPPVVIVHGGGDNPGNGGNSGGATGSPTDDGQPLTMTVCAGGPVPQGYIVYGDSFDGARCGFPTDISSRNVWAVQRYDDKPIGAMLDVCIIAPTPPGWQEVGRFWSAIGCSPGDLPTGQNMKRIRRVS